MVSRHDPIPLSSGRDIILMVLTSSGFVSILLFSFSLSLSLSLFNASVGAGVDRRQPDLATPPNFSSAGNIPQRETRVARVSGQDNID